MRKLVTMFLMASACLLAPMASGAEEPQARPKLTLFSDATRQKEDKAILNFIERAMYDKTNGKETVAAMKVEIIKGTAEDFKSVDPGTPCSIRTFDGQQMEVEWTLSDKQIAISLPIGYDTANEGTRAEIEQRFIDRLRSGKPVKEAEVFQISDFFPEDNMKIYKDSVLVLPGEKYQTRKITSNTYYREDTIAPSGYVPLWDTAYPSESFANMMILAEPKEINPKVNLTLLKHEYGEKETFNVTLKHLLNVCRNEGCLPFWGVEKYEGGKLDAALFMYNPTRGYDHIFRIECNPVEVMAGKGEIKARGGIYIPANNVKNLYAPHEQVKSDDEKIKVNIKN